MEPRRAFKLPTIVKWLVLCGLAGICVVGIVGFVAAATVFDRSDRGFRRCETIHDARKLASAAQLFLTDHPTKCPMPADVTSGDACEDSAG